MSESDTVHEGTSLQQAMRLEQAVREREELLARERAWSDQLIEAAAARDRALADVQAERHRLFEIFMQAPAAITLLEGPEHVFTVVNPLYRELIGGRDVQGKPFARDSPSSRGRASTSCSTGSTSPARRTPRARGSSGCDATKAASSRTSIANMVTWIEEDIGDRITGESREHMRLLKGRVNRMEGLIEGVLAYSRAGRVRERIETVEIGALIAETVELLAPPATMTISIAPGMPTIRSERTPLQQVFINLIGNAIKYSGRDDARIDIRVQPDGENCHRYTVADTAFYFTWPNRPRIAP